MSCILRRTHKFRQTPNLLTYSSKTSFLKRGETAQPGAQLVVCVAATLPGQDQPSHLRFAVIFPPGQGAAG